MVDDPMVTVKRQKRTKTYQGENWVNYLGDRVNMKAKSRLFHAGMIPPMKLSLSDILLWKASMCLSWQDTRDAPLCLIILSAALIGRAVYPIHHQLDILMIATLCFSKLEVKANVMIFKYKIRYRNQMK